MNAEQVMVFAVYFSVPLALWAAFFVAVPLLARNRFRLRVDKIRDDCMDYVISGQVPLAPSVQHFLRVQDYLGSQAREVTVMQVTLDKTTFDSLGYEPEPRPSFDELDGRARNLMYGLENDALKALALYLTRGSFAGWMLALTLIPRRRRRRRAERELRRQTKHSSDRARDIAAEAFGQVWGEVRPEGGDPSTLSMA